jgi:hypothetical protein
MRRHTVRTAIAAAIVSVWAAAALPSRAAAQEVAPSRLPAAWEALPAVVAEGKTVVVTMRDGQTAKGRVRSLSDTAIVIDSGRLRTIRAVDVETIENGRAGRRVKSFAARGFKAGAALGGVVAISWLLFQPHDGPCTSDDCLTGSDALFAVLFFPAAGTAVGAGVGLMVPGGRRVLYTRSGYGAVTIAPLAGHGRRGAELRVAF